MNALEATFILTAYSIGCDAPGPFTKAGTRPVSEFTVAADPLVLPLGSILQIEGLPGERMVHDVGSKIKGRRLDLYFDTCREAQAFGRQKRSIKVLHRPRKKGTPR